MIHYCAQETLKIFSFKKLKLYFNLLRSNLVHGFRKYLKPSRKLQEIVDNTIFYSTLQNV